MVRSDRTGLRRLCRQLKLCVWLRRDNDARQRVRDVAAHCGQCSLKRARIDHERDTENERSNGHPLQSLDAPLVPQIPENPFHYGLSSLSPPPAASGNRSSRLVVSANSRGFSIAIQILLQRCHRESLERGCPSRLNQFSEWTRFPESCESPRRGSPSFPCSRSPSEYISGYWPGLDLGRARMPDDQAGVMGNRRVDKVHVRRHHRPVCRGNQSGLLASVS